MDGITFAGFTLTSGSGSNKYEDHTNISTDVNQGGTYILTVTTGNPYPQNDFGVWIDYNDNDSFDDPGEQVICTIDDGANGDYEIFIPVDAANIGSHRMRIRTKWSGSDCGGSCGESTYGEVEDYTINICENLEITGPNNQTKCEGETVSFTVSVIGTEPITYVWKKGTEILSDGGNITGSTTNSLTITSAELVDTGTYRCEVTDVCGEVDTNSVAVLTLNLATEITQQPTDVNNASAGSIVSFKVSATGTNLMYQWRLNGSNITDATKDSLQIQNITASNSGNYDVVVTGACGEVTSNTAALSVATSVNELADFGIGIKPNPSKGIFNISYSKNYNEVEVTIISFEGKIVYQEKQTGDNNSVDISDKAQGTYLIRFKIKDKIISSRIVLL